MNTRAVQSGFTMLEVLISILIISIGLLGLAGLQTLSLKGSQSAYYRSVATQLAYDMSDRMRGNLNGVYSQSYNRTGISTDYSTAVGNCNSTTGCSGPQLAQNDAKEWQDAVALQLPSGQGIICIDRTPNDVNATPAAPLCDGLVPANPNERPMWAIKIWWLDDRSAANPTGTKKIFVYTLRL